MSVMNLGGLLSLVSVIVPLVMLAAGIVAISHFIELEQKKGCIEEKTGVYWFIGLFASPLVLGLYVAAAPDAVLPSKAKQRESIASHASSAASSLGAIEEIKQLKELCDEGAITKEEFSRKKREILGM